MKTSPACRRAVLESIEALRRQGHECIEIEIPSGMINPLPTFYGHSITVDFLVLESFRIFAGLTSADAYRTILSHLGPDPMVCQILSTQPRVEDNLSNYRNQHSVSSKSRLIYLVRLKLVFNNCFVKKLRGRFHSRTRGLVYRACYRRPYFRKCSEICVSKAG